MPQVIPPSLVTFEMANNHMGSVDHGLRIIREFAEIAQEFNEFSFAFKLQYRDLDTFIHPTMRGREDVKYIKRFSETRISRSDFDRLVEEIRAQGMFSMATPFDEASVKVIEDQGLDIIKVASCSFGDWPLLERIVKTDKPIIASTAGAVIDTLDSVVSFLQHRKKCFAILHCVAEYPAPDEHLQLGQIDFLRQRYPGVRVGFSTHEDPTHFDLVGMAIAKGADIFEKHVAVPTNLWPANAYSSTPEQTRQWLQTARRARAICGQSQLRAPINLAEQNSLDSLRRGVFLKRPVLPGVCLSTDDVYFAFPPEPGQVTANQWSKYARFTVTTQIAADAPLTTANSSFTDRQIKVLEIAGRVKSMLAQGHITVPGGVDLEISHHYGIERFDEVGLTMLTIINRGYCKKLLVCLPGQEHPEQHHRRKEETFHVLYGEIHLTLNGHTRTCQAGEVVNIEPGVRHAFSSIHGAVIEEISSTHWVDDSFYTDESINRNPDRKTLLTYWMV
jgi:sialic acid synthase SpsE/mannose-6-phosphate isomerase-like protein (cupin superfamily)